MALTISLLAVKDIEEIGDYIASDNPVRAMNFVEDIYEQCRLIGETPALYRQRPELGDKIRCCVYGRYLIVFSEKQRFVRVERVLHSAREIAHLIRS